MKKFKTTSFYDMAKIDKKDTKLPVDIWVNSLGKNRNSHQNLPIVKIPKDKNNDTQTGNLVPIVLNNTILVKGATKLTENEIKDIIQFLERNKDFFLKHWNGEINDRELLNSVK